MSSMHTRCYIMLRKNDDKELALLETMEQHGYQPYNGYSLPGDVYTMYLFHLCGPAMLNVVADLLLNGTIVRYVIDHEELPQNWGSNEEMVLRACQEGDLVLYPTGSVYRVGKTIMQNGHKQIYVISDMGNNWPDKSDGNIVVTRLQTRDQMLARAHSLGL